MKCMAMGITAAVAVGLLSICRVTAQEAPKPAGDAKTAEVKLPPTDPKAEAMMKAAWAKVECWPAHEKEPLVRFASKGSSKIDASKIEFPRWAGEGAKKMIEDMVVELNTAWTKGNAFSSHVHDQAASDAPPPPQGGGQGGGAGRWGDMGLRMAVRGAITKVTHVLPYILGSVPFDDEFKDATFEFWKPEGKPASKEEGELPMWDKELKAVRVWRNVLGRPVFQTYYIDKKGKGTLATIQKDGKLFSFEYVKGKKLVRIEKLSIRPDTPPAPKEEPKEGEKKDDDNDDEGGRGGGGRGGPGGGGRGGPGGGGRGPGGGAGQPALPEGHEEYTFEGRKAFGIYELSTAVTTQFAWNGYRLPITVTLRDIAVNKDATDEMIAAGGFGPSQGLPDPTRESEKDKKPAGDKPAGDSEAKKEGEAGDTKDSGKADGAKG